MRKVFTLSFVLLLISSFSFAITFAPTPLRLSAEEKIQYAFDGSTLEIPVIVTGTPALLRFMVFTKGKSDEIIDIRNGYLGWHYMNKIDTCIYMSGDYKFTPGSNKVIWNGRDNDGGEVQKGDYTYYLWAFDDQSLRIKAVPESVNGGSESGDRCREQFLEYDQKGNALATPVWSHRYWRWVMGNDPENKDLFETCTFDLGEDWGHGGFGQWIIEPDDWSTVYLHGFNKDTSTCGIFRYKWVPTDFGQKDNSYDVVYFSTLNNYLVAETDNNYIYIGESNYKEIVLRTYLHIIDHKNSEYIGYMDHSEVFESINDYENFGELMNGGYTLMVSTPQGLLVGGNHCCCLRAASDPLSWFDDPDDTIRWENGNGDYVVWDNNWETTSEIPWVCNALSSKRSNHGMTHDINGFINTGQYHGAVSFEEGTPDGTGVGQFSYAAEIDYAKGGGIICDNGSAFDGAYVPMTGEGVAARGRWYVARDSFKGVISSGVGVEEEVPAAFSVAQNSPNPFNPTTTVSMTLAEEGNVTVDVFNVAGQKVDSLVDGFKEAGSHSVVWDASDFSAGVYFCTVRSGDFSKTFKMTLLK
ncbi:T9SS type A sorting domain-containing protein [Candidatus Latescibacterota bacterium]